MRGQASLEMLLVLGAVLAFGAALLPQELGLAARARLAVVDAVQRQALQEVADGARQAYAAGPGTAITLEVYLGAEGSALEYEAGSSQLALRYGEQGKSVTRRAPSPPIEVEGGGNLRRGRYRIRIEDHGETVRLALAPLEAVKAAGG